MKLLENSPKLEWEIFIWIATIYLLLLNQGNNLQMIRKTLWELQILKEKGLP